MLLKSAEWDSLDSHCAQSLLHWGWPYKRIFLKQLTLQVPPGICSRRQFQNFVAIFSNIIRLDTHSCWAASYRWRPQVKMAGHISQSAMQIMVFCQQTIHMKCVMSWFIFLAWKYCLFIMSVAYILLHSRLLFHWIQTLKNCNESAPKGYILFAIVNFIRSFPNRFQLALSTFWIEINWPITKSPYTKTYI